MQFPFAFDIIYIILQMEIQKILSESKFLGEALTFDDVLLVPDYSEVLPARLIYQVTSHGNSN